MRRINEQSHQATTDGSGNGDSHDPSQEQEANTLEVDGLEGTIAQTDTDGRASDAHGCGDGQGVLGEHEDGDGGAEFHRGATAGGVVGDFVTHDCKVNVSILFCGMLNGIERKALDLPFMMLYP